MIHRKPVMNQDRKRKGISFTKTDSKRLLELASEIKQLTDQFQQPEVDRPHIVSKD